MLFIQCTTESSSSAIQENNDSSLVQNRSILNDAKEGLNKNKTEVARKLKVNHLPNPDSLFTLDTEMTYVPDVQTCIYIRTSPSIEDSNIIQCLIPESKDDLITGMSHQLRPTGKIEGDWAEFYYEFDVYTLKPDVQDKISYEEWSDKRTKAHEAAKKKYRAYRSKGWIKFRNGKGKLNIKSPSPGC